jgi:carbonic anhydrase
MERLIEGHKRFMAEVYPELKSTFQLLAHGQAPEWLLIACADSRVVPDMILGTAPGDLFITRSIGNIVPPASEPDNGTAATVEYAIEALGIRHVIVFGHSDCGSLKSAFTPDGLKKLPLSQHWLEYAKVAHNHRQPLNPADGESAELAALLRGNVVAQMKNLSGYPTVAKAVSEGRLTVHGWYFDILTGQIERYDEKRKKFVTLK